MNNILPPFFKNIDAWLLLNYPRIWASRIHNFLYILLALMLIGFVIGLSLSFSFELVHAYIVSVITPYFMVGLVILTVAVLWLTRFRTKIATLNYKESFLLTTGVALLSMLMFLTPWFIKLGHEKRIAASYNNAEIEHDLLLSSLLENACKFNQAIDTIEDIKIGNYTLKAEETKLIKYNMDFLDVMDHTLDSSEILNSMAVPEDFVNDSRNEWFSRRNNRIIASKVKAIRQLKTVPDSLVQIYEMLLHKNLDEYLKSSYYTDPSYPFKADAGNQAFLYCQLHKISPTWNYLRTKYNQEDVGNITSKLGNVYMIQRQQLLPALLFSSTNLNSFEMPRDYEDVDQQSKYWIQIKQSRVEILKTSYQNFVQNWRFYELMNQAIWFILMLSLPILFIINFGIRQTIFSFLGFIVSISFLQLCFGLFLLKDNMQPLIYFLTLFIIGTSLFLIFNKDSKHKKWGQFFIPLSILLTFYCVIMMHQSYSSNKSMNGEYYFSLESIFMNYGIFVLPLLFMTYHRLAFLPKEK